MFLFEKKTLKYFDIWLVLFIVILFSFGLLILGSALHIKETSDSRYYKQIIGFSSGLVVMVLAAFFRYDFLKKLFLVFYIVNIGLLGLVLIIGVGNDVSRWIDLGPVRIQPSEFAKILIILFLARFMEKYEDKTNKLWFIAICTVLVLIPTALIKLQPDLSTSIILILLLASALFVAGLDTKYILVAVLIAVPIVCFVIWDAYQNPPIFLEKYQALRIQSLFDPEAFAQNEAYQTMKSIQAIGSGGLEGSGLYGGILNKNNFIPVPENDFIFAVAGEEFGFMGCTAIIGLYILIISRCLWIGANAPDLFGKLICTGVASLFGFQAFVNMGVATGILPNTGIPLPFVSQGMSSLWANLIGVGLVLNVGMMKSLSYSRR